MTEATRQTGRFREALTENSETFAVKLTEDALRRLCQYYELLMSWNSRLHLVAPCSAEEFAQRHVLESLMLTPQLGKNARIADIGSGGGLPIIPNLIARPDIQATLIEVSAKKCVFLKEALRVTEV